MGASAMVGYAGITMGGSMVAYGIGTLTGTVTPFTKALETARLMKQANCEPDFIMQMTGLSKEEVENI